VVEQDLNRIGVIANCNKPHAPAVLQSIASRSRDLGLTLVTCDRTADLLPDAQRVPVDTFPTEIDVLMALGGDGTMLAAVRALQDCSVPVVGVNLGSLGFLTSVPEDEAERALEVLAEGSYTSSTRSLADCEVHRNGECIGTHRCLNDMVIGWGESSRVITLSLLIDEVNVTEYVCDGLIVSTPTGSTGHQLSTGGPILHPEASTFVVSVICPHTLSTRPLVIPDDSLICMHVSDSPKELIMAVDGQETQHVRQGDRIEVRRSPQSIRFIHLPGYNYFSVLRQKLGWRGSIR